jgi:hypothetical protein
MICLEAVVGKMPIMVTRWLPTLQPYYKVSDGRSGASITAPLLFFQFEEVEI